MLPASDLTVALTASDEHTEVMDQIIDVWMQHPTLRHSNHEMFDSLRRWMGIEGTLTEAIPLDLTIASMDKLEWLWA